MAEPIALRVRMVRLDGLALNDANARLHPPRNLEQIKRSLERFGQRLPVVVQKDGMVVRAGNGRVMAARELGWEEIAAVVVDEPAVEAAAYAIADNRTGDTSAWDFEALVAQLDGLKADGVSLEDVGFDEDELAAMRADMKWLPKQEAPPEGGVYSGDGEAARVTCPNCGHEFSP